MCDTEPKIRIEAQATREPIKNEVEQAKKVAKRKKASKEKTA